MSRAREEVFREVARGPFNLASIRALGYLDRVCKESRRVAPVLPITFFGKVKRECNFQGTRIPAGHQAVGCIGATLLDERTYPGAERFDPDRWLNATDEQKRAWIPHGGGIHAEGHRCAGEALATLMLQTFAASMLRKYDWTFPEGQDFSANKGKIFATPAGGLEVRISPLPA
jgi:fatty-acid peroxygenase